MTLRDSLYIAFNDQATNPGKHMKAAHPEIDISRKKSTGKKKRKRSPSSQEEVEAEGWQGPSNFGEHYYHQEGQQFGH